MPGGLALALRRPAGVVLGIAPWNAPVILAVRAIAVPLACGNTVVLKGSEICPATHGLIIDALHEAGLPKGVVNCVTDAPEDAGAVVDATIAHPAVRRVKFTGSNENRTDRVILDPRNRAAGPVATVRMPCRIHEGFHGVWVPERELAATADGKPARRT